MEAKAFARSNCRAKVSVEFEASDILVMVDALSIGSTTAMMCGGKAVAERLRQLSDMFRGMSPLPNSSRSEGYAWFEACMLLRGAPWFEAYVVPAGGSWNHGKAHIDLDVGGKVLRVCEMADASEAKACIEQLNDFLAEIAGMDTHRLERTEARVSLPEGTPGWGDGFRTAVKAAVEELLDGSGHTCVVREAEYAYDDDRPAARVTVAVPAHERSAVPALLEAGERPSLSTTR